MKKKYSSAFAKKSDTEVADCTADFMQWGTFLSSGMPRSFQREMLEITKRFHYLGKFYV